MAIPSLFGASTQPGNRPSRAALGDGSPSATFSRRLSEPSGCDFEEADQPVAKRESIAEVGRSPWEVSSQSDPGDIAIAPDSLPSANLDRVLVFIRGSLPPPANLCVSAPVASLIGDLRVFRVGSPQVAGDNGREIHPRSINVDPIPAHRHTLTQQQLALPLSLWNRPVSPNDAIPRKAFVSCGQYAPDEPRRLRIDFAIAANGTFRNLSNSGDDARDSRLVTQVRTLAT